MLSHTLREAVINAVLALGLADAGAVELFDMLERFDIKKKWRIGLKSFAPKYSFPLGGDLDKTLSYLSRQRNALVHNKIELHIDDKRVLEGSGIARKPYVENIEWIKRFFSLPYDLVEYVQRSKYSDWGIKSIPFIVLPRESVERAHIF
jgi:hypothetical protein